MTHLYYLLHFICFMFVLFQANEWTDGRVSELASAFIIFLDFFSTVQFFRVQPRCCCCCCWFFSIFFLRECVCLLVLVFLLYFCFYYYYYNFFVLNFCFGCISCCCCGCWLYSIVFYISIDLNCIHRSPSDQHLGHNRHSSGHCCNKCCKIVCILGALIHKHAVA